MPNFPIIMRAANLEPFEGTVQAENIEAAIEVAAKMGHNVDREATLELAAKDADRPGSTANLVAIIVSLAGWLQPAIGLTAIILAVIAVERSNKRRGYPALILAFVSTIAGLILTYGTALGHFR